MIIILPYLGKIIAVILAKVAKPAGSREFGRFLLEQPQMFSPQEFNHKFGGNKLFRVIISQLLPYKFCTERWHEKWRI
jgi:hypothetical protein